MLHLFRETNGGDFYAARDEAHAQELLEKDVGKSDAEDSDWARVHDDKAIKVGDEDGGAERLQASEWAARAPASGGYVFGENY